MKLRNSNFGKVLAASGVQGFFGEGYWFHRPWRMLGMDLSTVTFVAKTATLRAHKGNMPLTERYTPRSLFPDCIRVKMYRGMVVNAVGLSNPGLGTLLETGKWQPRTKPFLISVMSLASSPSGRMSDFRWMVDEFRAVRDRFSAPFGVQINLSCPNTGHSSSHELIRESADILTVMGTLGVPIMPKYSIASAPVEAILQLNDHPDCDAVCVSNTIPFGWEGLDWKHVWGSNTSPLSKLSGGLSGKPLCTLVCEWISHLRYAGFTKPINGGGGILCAEDVDRYHTAGASSIFLGSVVLLRPWRVRQIVNRANELDWKE